MLQEKTIRYKDLKINYNMPEIWRRPEREKLLREGRSYNDFLKEIAEFDKLKNDIKDEILSRLNSNVDISTTKNELNVRMSEIFEHYAKALIPTDDIDTKFLLNKTNKNTLNIIKTPF